jgi:Cu+-exporting ATPase
VAAGVSEFHGTGEPSPEAAGAQSAGDAPTHSLLTLAAALEQLSEHPLADAVVRAAHQRGIAPPTAESFVALPGLGARGVVEGRAVIVGNARLMDEWAVSVAAVADAVNRFARAGRTVLYVASDGTLLGVIAVADPIRPAARGAIEWLRGLGLRLVMVTGDTPRTAAAVAQAVGISDVVAGVLPDGKVAEVTRRQAAGHVIAMVGDGINDAPALARADVGIAIGAGADVAVEASDVTLMRDDLTGVVTAIALSRRTMRIMKQNLFWAFVYNVIGIPVAAGVLFPAFGILLNPILASAAMALSSVSVVSNSLRLRRFRPAVAAVVGTP